MEANIRRMNAANAKNNMIGGPKMMGRLSEWMRRDKGKMVHKWCHSGLELSSFEEKSFDCQQILIFFQWKKAFKTSFSKSSKFEKKVCLKLLSQLWAFMSKLLSQLWAFMSKLLSQFWAFMLKLFFSIKSFHVKASYELSRQSFLWTFQEYHFNIETEFWRKL